jgi:hypothetical protein
LPVNVPAFAPAPTEDDSFHTGLSYTLNHATKVYVASFEPTTISGQVAVNPGDAIATFMGNIWVPSSAADPTTGASSVFLSRQTRMSQCRIDAVVNYRDNSVGDEGNAVNCLVTAGGEAREVSIVGGIWQSGSVYVLQVSGILVHDVILHGEIGLTQRLDLNLIGWVYLDGQLSINGPAGVIGDQADSGILYGAGTVDVSNGSAYLIYSGLAADAFTGGIVFNTDPTVSNPPIASAYNTAVDPAVWHARRSLTPAQIDTSIASGGFGGTAHLPGGGVISPEAVA